MQRFADGRAKKGISPVTVRKEVHTLRAAWNWGKRLGLTDREYPGRGIVYAHIAPSTQQDAMRSVFG